MFVGLSHAPNDDHCIQGSTGHHEAVGTPGNTVDASIVEAPFNLIVFFICGESVDHHLETQMIKHSLNFQVKGSKLHNNNQFPDSYVVCPSNLQI